MNAPHFLQALVAPAVEAAGYRLVRLRLMGGQRKTLQVMAERQDGQMDVEDCTALDGEILTDCRPGPEGGGIVQNATRDHSVVGGTRGASGAPVAGITPDRAGVTDPNSCLRRCD